MQTKDNEITRLNELIKEYGGVDSYTTTQAANLFQQICKIIVKQGFNPQCRAEFFEGVSKLFNLEFVNMGNYTHGKYVFVPNHVTEFDGILFGTILPNMMAVAKSDWVSNPQLNSFLEKLFLIASVIRKDKSSGMKVLRKCMDHLNASEDAAVTIFVQQTIADIEITMPEDVASGAYFIAKNTGAQIIPVYCEQVSTEHPTRIVFGEPLDCTNRKEFGNAWLKSEFALRDSITSPAARPPILCEKHRTPISQREF